MSDLERIELLLRRAHARNQDRFDRGEAPLDMGMQDTLMFLINELTQMTAEPARI